LYANSQQQQQQPPPEVAAAAATAQAIPYAFTRATLLIRTAVHGCCLAAAAGMMVPLENYGVKCISMGFFTKVGQGR
jgi:hypothetical protein